MTTEIVRCPGSDQCEQKAKGSIQGVDELKSVVIAEDLGVDFGGIRRKGALTSQLLSAVKSNSQD